jgi:hypothetical protein
MSEVREFHETFVLEEPVLDLWVLEDMVNQAFEDAVGEDAVDHISVHKYPSNYGVVVWVKKKELAQMLHLTNHIEREYRRHGFRVQVSVEEVKQGAA